MKYSYKNVLYMLRESNAIEDEFGRTSLVQAHRAWKFLAEKDKLCTECVLMAHRILMTHHNIENKYKGNWRDVPVTIGGKLKAQPRIVIDSLMRDYVEYLNALPDNILEAHVKFESIHPFIDGNGRMGRILMNWHSMKKNNELLVFSAKNKHEIYYPIFSNRYESLRFAETALKDGRA